ncbi:ectonucleotide pyrophosphatase/phosphodiesterase family member 3 isoform X1 [Pseudonaja textilis]|uniref:ectonucleotide pyrophosphatase/phosphodiesterase family member 3 isoform X1 n=1 Tax=Pseudonaja textilis TaxID=8673 RepID=UPI000EA96A09|nr:ectonucleotide pyrophosphatase/phosphodiesterase family member 3 isoform X1 [Pseudonaja textilis]
METLPADQTDMGEKSTLELLDFHTETVIKKSTLRKYKILCVVLFISLVAVALGLGLGLGLKQSKQPQESCRNRCNETFSEELSYCSCDNKCTEREACCWDYQDTCVLPTQSWSCNKLRCGEKRMANVLCSCSEDCLTKKDCCTDYKSICKRETSWLKDQCASSSASHCPEGFDQSPLILFSMDGFRAEYLETWDSLMPNINKLKTCGTHAKYMRAAYPTKTFVNHYTIVTGLYAETHGIIDNNMYDVNLNQNFSLSGKNMRNPAWWGGQPIWHTATSQGLKAATYFWPGSEVKINGSFPTIYKVYNKSTPFEARVMEVLQWLDLPKAKRPDFSTLYIEEPDTTGHKFGPVSGQVSKSLQMADRTLGMLMEGLKQRNLHNCVNLILLADHGMEAISCNRLEYMADYFNTVDFFMYEGAAPRIRSKNVPKDFYTFDSEAIVKNLTCRKPKQHFKAYLAKDLPKRLHFANNVRIDKVNLMVDRQWLAVRNKKYKYCSGGTHGYDNEFKSMEAIFVAHGPSFKEKNEVTSFENIEVYNLMCDLLKLKPAPNNGTHGSLNHLLKNPFHNPSPAKEQSSPLLCHFGLVPSPDVSGCNCSSITDLEAVNQRLNLTDQAKMQSEADNLPYGRPHVLQHSKYCLLHQTKYISAYSQDILMPLWNSYTISKSLVKPTSVPPSASDCLRLDVRIPAAQSQTCSNYQPDLTITPGFLYPPDFSSSGPGQYDALITSNIAPMYKEFTRLWNYFHSTLLPKYATERNGLNVINGPIFDYNYDGHFDSYDTIKQYVNNTKIPIPTHYFVVLTSCENSTKTPLNCPPGSLKVLSFILPHRPDNSESCADKSPDNLWVEERMQAHTARVRDVELLTGLDFYSELKQPLSETLRLKTFLPIFVNSVN